MSANCSNDRAGLCSFVFKDGRHCRLPVHAQGADHCLPHALKYRRIARAEELGQIIAEPFTEDFLSASDLNSALCRVFSAIAQGLMSPKTAKPLVDLSRTMLKAIPLARQEFISVYGEDELIETMADSFDRQVDPEPSSDDLEPSSKDTADPISIDDSEPDSTDDPEPSTDAVDTPESLVDPSLLTPLK
jgi:hypothetical protein